MIKTLKQDVGVVSLAIHGKGIQEVHARGTGHAPQGRPARHWGSPMYLS